MPLSLQTYAFVSLLLMVAAESDSCGFFSTLNFGADALAITAIAAGLIVTFYGQKLIRPASFLSGFTLGAFLSVLLAGVIFRHSSYLVIATWLAFFLGGFVVGSLVVYVYTWGIFAIGAVAGILLATQLNIPMSQLLYSSYVSTGLIVLSVLFGLISGFMALKLERPFLIFSTACTGAIITIWGIGYFAGNYPNQYMTFFPSTWHSDTTQYSIPNEYWAYVVAMIIMTLFGVCVQFQQRTWDKRAHEDKYRNMDYQHKLYHDNAWSTTSLEEYPARILV